jgi:hypothetical protein
MIGHSAIIAVLFTIMSDDSLVENVRRVPLLAPVGFGAALTVSLLAYYVGRGALRQLAATYCPDPSCCIFGETMTRHDDKKPPKPKAEDQSHKPAKHIEETARLASSVETDFPEFEARTNKHAGKHNRSAASNECGPNQSKGQSKFHDARSAPIKFAIEAETEGGMFCVTRKPSQPSSASPWSASCSND